MSAHPRFSLNSICSMRQSLDEDLALWTDLGIEQVGLISPKLAGPGWDAAARAVRAAGLRVASMSCYPREIAQSLEFSSKVGAGVMYVVSGGAGSQPWEEAAANYCDAIAPMVSRARELGVKLAVEPTNPLRSDVSFVHTVRDAIDLARMA